MEIYPQIIYIYIILLLLLFVNNENNLIEKIILLHWNYHSFDSERMPA